MKQAFRLIFVCIILSALVFGAPGPVVASADHLQAQKTSPSALLNSDGTLNLKGGFQGALDLAGWDVQVDPQRGPIFAPEAVVPGQWANLGTGKNGALKNWVYAVAVSGTDVYVGGSFTNVNNNGTVLPAADYIAKWTGSNWSALGSNGMSNGSLNNFVAAIAIKGTSLYAGGSFRNVNNNGTILPAADHLAVYGLGAVPTPTRTRTATKTATATQSPTATPTTTIGASATPSPSPSPTGTMTETPTETPTPTQTIGASPTETETPTVTPTP